MSKNAVMKVITRQTRANEAADRWKDQYKNDTDLRALKIGRSLRELPYPVDPDKVDKITGNTSWTITPSCNVCSKMNSPVIEVGEEADYESSTAYLCFDCVRAIGKMANAFEGEFNEDDRRS